MDLSAEIVRVIRRQRMLRAGEQVAVACSGGADSVALLLLLNELKATLGIHLLVAHLNHQLRGAAADADEAFVQELAARLGLEFVAERVDVAARAKAARANVEEAGRQARLEFFARLCATGRADAVALGHTQDDQAETLLVRLVRGTGLTGLAGIYPVMEPLPGIGCGRLIRPLLEVRRTALREFLQERKQAWREDLSNLDPARTRNRIRLEVLPRLAELSPAVVARLAGLARQAQHEEAFWRVFIEERFSTLSEQVGSEWSIAVARLLEPLRDFAPLAEGAGARVAEEAQRAVAQRLVRRLVSAAKGHTRRLTQEQVEEVLRLAETGTSGQSLSLAGLSVERRFDRLVFRAEPRQGRLRQGSKRVLCGGYCYQVEVPGSVAIASAGCRLEFKLVAAEEAKRGYNNRNVAVVDAAAVKPCLQVRNWRVGDRYQPAGYARPKKLKMLFQRAHIPLGCRATYPVVVSGEEIIWVPGFGVAAAYAMREATQTALVIVEEPLEKKRALE